MSEYLQIVRRALAEDLKEGKDLTSECFIADEDMGQGWIESRQASVVSGMEIAAQVFREVDASLKVEILVADGNAVSPMEHVLNVSGKAWSILAAERTALNFLGHLSGIATLTNKFVTATKPWGTRILCTRKTTPGLRALEIAAVRHGGGDVFRENLTDAVLVKDNHIGIAGGFAGFMDRLRSLQERNPGMCSDVLLLGKLEVSSLAELNEAVTMGWKQILLDNFTPSMVSEAVKQWGKHVFLEVSGGVNSSNIEEYAVTGVQAISIGALTHSIMSSDFSLEVLWSQT